MLGYVNKAMTLRHKECSYLSGTQLWALKHYSVQSRVYIRSMTRCINNTKWCCHISLSVFATLLFWWVPVAANILGNSCFIWIVNFGLLLLGMVLVQRWFDDDTINHVLSISNFMISLNRLFLNSKRAIDDRLLCIKNFMLH